jgi:hypothetical protein
MFTTTRLSFLWTVALILSSGCLPSDHETPSNTSIEYKLAAIQQGGYVREDDPLVVQFGEALDRLESKCPEPRERLADMGVKGRQILLGKGVDEPLLSVFQNWGASLPGETTKGEVGPCADVLAVYVTLRAGH